MSRHPERPMRLRTRLVAAFVAVATLTVVAPASADLKIVSSYVGPIESSSPCTAEPRDTLATDMGNFPFGSPYNNADYPASAPAKEDVTANLQAGARTDYCIGYALTPDMNLTNGADRRRGYAATPDELLATQSRFGDDQKRLVVETPVGFAAAITSATECAEGDGAFGMGNSSAVVCDPSSQVGVGTFRVSAGNAPNLFQDQRLLIPGQVIVRLPAAADEVARLGAAINAGPAGVTKFVISVKFAQGEPLRLVSIVDPVPRMMVNPFNPNLRFAVYVETVALRLWGAKADHASMAGNFAESGTQCATDVSASIAMETYGRFGSSYVPDPANPANSFYAGETPTNDWFTGVLGPVATAPPVARQEQTSSYRLTGCGAPGLAFDPTVTVSTTENRPAVPTGVTVKLGLGQSDPAAATGTALLKDAAVTLPPGLELGAQVGARSGGLALCAPAQFDRTATTPAGCPAASKVGTVRIDSPLIAEPLSGTVFLGPQAEVGELPDLYLEASLAGRTDSDTPRIKLVGATTVSADGQITSTFKDNPELRFSELRLDFPAGDNALFITPRSCGDHTATSRLTSWARPAEQVPVSATLSISDDCALPPFAPAASVVPSSPQAGAKAPVSIGISRTDRSPWLNDVHVSLPTGQLADLTVVPECSLSAAASGACGAESRIASVRSVAGAGSSPLTLDGAMYLVQHTPGNVAGAVIVVRAQIGALDLGNVVVPGTIHLRPFDAGLDFVTKAPTRFRGLALNLQSIVVNLDRENFALNPSSCGPIGYSATITSDAGGSALAGGQVAYAGCESLPFGPKLEASLTGEVRPGGHPGMSVKLTMPAGGTMRGAHVILPEGVSTDLKNIQVRCERADFDAVRCPAETHVGSVSARVSITHELITGDVYLVRVPGEVLPGIGLSFTGRFAQRLASIVKINSQGRIAVNFPEIPDLPLREFTIDVKGGAKGPLQLPPGACAANTRWDGTFTSWGGQVTKSEYGLRCAAKSKVRLSQRRGLTVRNFDFGGRNLRYVKATLPSGMTFNTKRAKSKRYTWARTKGSARNKLRLTKRSITVTPATRKATDVRVKVQGAALKATRRAATRKSYTVKLRFVFTDGAVQTQEVRYKLPQPKGKKGKKRAKR